jgi:hypothetical protein
MIQQMGERLASKGDAEAAAVGEIRQPLQARRMLLTKDQLPFRRTIQGG